MHNVHACQLAYVENVRSIERYDNLTHRVNCQFEGRANWGWLDVGIWEQIQIGGGSAY